MTEDSDNFDFASDSNQTSFNDEINEFALDGVPTRNNIQTNSYSGSVTNTAVSRSAYLPWAAHKENSIYFHHSKPINVDSSIRPGEFVVCTLFADFTLQAERKIEIVMAEPPEKSLAKVLQRGEDAQFDQLVLAFGSVAEYCLPSLLRTLFSWYERQMGEVNLNDQKKSDQRVKSLMNIVTGTVGGGSGLETIERSEGEIQQERRDLAVEFLFCRILTEVLKKLPFHPGHEDLVTYIENLAIKHFRFKEGSQNNPNAVNLHIVADLYAEVIGVVASCRYMSVRKRFTAELKELRTREPCHHTTQSIISLLMGMKFFRVKMVPIEEFEASFQFMHEAAQYFLEVKDKDIKHALAGLFVEILGPIADNAKNEVNVPCLKNFVEMVYPQTLDYCTKSKHRLALFPLVTTLLCVSQKIFFLQNWHYFLAMCLSHLKNKDSKMSRVALESLCRLIWVYMIRIKCESNSATQSRLQSIVNSIFPKGSKAVVPRDSPLFIFVKIIQFISYERLDFAMREIVFDLLSIGRPIKIIQTPERMNIGLRAFLVVADSLEQKEGSPPMPKTIAVLPSGNTLRVRKTFLNKMLTDDMAKNIGISSYFPYVRRVFTDILRALDVHYGKPMMMTNNAQNFNKDSDEKFASERKPRIDLFRTCIAAIPRLIPDGMTGIELVDLLSRLTVHSDEELRTLAYQSLQTLLIDFHDWRQDVLWGFTQFLARDVLDTFPQLLDNGMRILLQLVTSWKNSLINQNSSSTKDTELKNLDIDGSKKIEFGQKSQQVSSVLYLIEAFALVMLCNYRQSLRKTCAHILRETKFLLNHFNCREEKPVLEVIDKCCPKVIEKCLPYLSPAEKQAVLSASNIDLQWISERVSSIWTAGPNDDSNISQNITLNFTDPWYLCLFWFLEKNYILKQCSTAIAHSWPLVFNRINTLISVIDPMPVSDNRASLLRTSVTIRKPVNERDMYIHVWRNYVTFAFRVVPPIPCPILRCASPDLSLGSSPDSLTIDRNETKSPSGQTLSPVALYKLIIPLLRCEVVEINETVINALGKINSDALKDLMDELSVYVREAVDRKQENVRRRRRRDALRLHLIRVFDLIAEYGTFGHNNSIIDRETLTLHQTLMEYIDGARQTLEMEIDKNSSNVHDVALSFCRFTRKMIKSFSVENQSMLLKSDLRRNLFSLFSTWAGTYSYPLKDKIPEIEVSELQFTALQAMSAVLCCGPCFDAKNLIEDGQLYHWLNYLLNSSEKKVYSLAFEIVILLLECNPDIGPLLDWVVDKCYTGSSKIADSCFLALATVFSIREYPCDHYTAIINVTLMNTSCSRINIQDTAFQLLQILDKRFFGPPTVPPVLNDSDSEPVVNHKDPETLDKTLSESFSRSHVFLSTQLARLHPELTMPIFSEITYRFQTAREEIQQILLQYLLPWLNNMELVDTNITISSYQCSDTKQHKDGLGSIETTEMILNNLFYLTTKFADKHQKELEDVWVTLCSSWPNNLKVIVRYVIIISGMSPTELLRHGKKVLVYLSHAQQDRLIDEIMNELQTIETLNCLIERTETPPFYRFTSMRKTSSHLEETINPQSISITSDELSEKGTIHTKRHSGEDPMKNSQQKDNNCMRNSLMSNINDKPEINEKYEKGRLIPHPLPMPEYGGYFAPLTEYLPDSSQPILGFLRCNIAIMLLTDVIADGIQIDLSIHLPLLFHIIFLGMDNTRFLVHDHCKQLLMNLLIVLSEHNDHLTVSQILLNHKIKDLNFGLTPNSLPVRNHDFTEPDPIFDSYLFNETVSRDSSINNSNIKNTNPIIITNDHENTTNSLEPEQNLEMTDIIKSFIFYLSTKKNQTLWNYEDITAKIWTVKSAEQIDLFLKHILRIFNEFYPHSIITERWAQIALHLGLSCSSRHYAGRSMQIFRLLRTPITSRMLSDILSRLVETVSEQGEDMQGYVTELLLTLESIVESLESEFRSLDLMKEIFKSTPNLNKEQGTLKKLANLPTPSTQPPPTVSSSGHTRSTSCSISYSVRRTTFMPSLPEQNSSYRQNSMNLSRSRSAQSLKFLTDPATQDDKLTILTQLFWLSVSLLESEYEHEFLLALRLLGRVLNRFPLDRPDARDKVDKLQSQLKWSNFIGVHALLLKGCCHPSIYESVVPLLSQFTLLLDLPVVDPSQSYAFPMNVVALLPYLILHYEDVNQLCIQSAENIAQISSEKSKKLENLATVMTLYSRRNFSKESFQWTKCVVKYLYDTYSHQTLNMLTFLVEMLEKGPTTMQLPILNIIHCMMHYVDLTASSHQPIYVDLLRVVAKYVEGPHWKETLKVMKLVVTRSSKLVAPPITIHHPYWETSFMSNSFNNETEFFSKKELPGRTMDFTFDLSQTPVIGRRFVKSETYSSSVSSSVTIPLLGTNSPKRTTTMSPADNTLTTVGWKKPWLAQSRVRECLVNLLTACGQRVGLPKSPSVIFSQSSDLIERQSSITSSTEEVSMTNNEQSNSSRKDDVQSDQFGVFKDFDFLEYESESVEGESIDNFNWGVRRRPINDDNKDDLSLKLIQDSTSDDQTPMLCERKSIINEESSDDEIESESPLDEIPVTTDFEAVQNDNSDHSPTTSIREQRSRNDSVHSASTESSVDDIVEDTTTSITEFIDLNVV